MDTLTIVRRIREAEALAEAGDHAAARDLLEPLLDRPGVSESHRSLVSRKLKLFDVRESRRRTSISSRFVIASRREEPEEEGEEEHEPPPAEEPAGSSADTDLGAYINEASGEDGSPRLKPVGREELGIVEVEEETGFSLEFSTELQAFDEEALEETPGKTSEEETRELEPSPSSSPSLVALEADAAGEEIELSPASSPSLDSIEAESAGDRPGTTLNDTESFDELPDVPTESTEIVPLPDEDFASTENPALEEDSSASTLRIERAPAPGTGLYEALQSSDTTEIDEASSSDDGYFPAPEERPCPSGRSTVEIEDWIRRAPAEAPGKDLALEVLYLREEVERLSGRAPEAAAEPSAPDRPVQTNVEKAKQADAWLPDRDDEAEELRVLRRDSVRKEAADVRRERAAASPPSATDAPNASETLEELAGSGPSILRPVGVLLGFLVLAGLIGWGAWWVARLVEGDDETCTISEEGAGDIRLGAVFQDSSILENAPVRGDVVRASDRRLVVQVDADYQVRAVTLPGPAAQGDFADDLGSYRVVFGGATLELTEDTSLDAVIEAFGQPTPPFSETVFASRDDYVLEYPTVSGDRVLEFHYRTSSRDRLLAVRIRDATWSRPLPELRPDP